MEHSLVYSFFKGCMAIRVILQKISLNHGKEIMLEDIDV